MKIDIQPRQINNSGINGRIHTNPGVSEGNQGKSLPPDVNIDSEDSTNSTKELFTSLSILFPGLPRRDVEVALMEVLEVLSSLLVEIEEDKIKFSQEETRTRLDAKLEALDKAERKLKRAMRKDKGNDVWSKIKMSFNFAAALGTLALGVAMTVGTTGFCPAGYAMMASGFFQLVLATDELVAELTGGYGIAGSITLALGGSKNQAAKADLGFRVGMVVLILACSIASCFLSMGSSPTVLAARAGQVKAYATVIQSIIGVGTAGADSYFAVRKFEAAELQRDSKYSQADANELEAMNAAVAELLDTAIAMIRALINSGNEWIGAVLEASSYDSDTIARMRLSA